MNSPRFKQVVLIDDNIITNTLHETLMTGFDFAAALRLFTSGNEALDYLKTDLDETLIPELIFLDINMPVMNGFDFLVEYKLLPNKILNKSKIIILSSSLNENDRKRASEFGVTNFLVKPLTRAMLEAL